jgi:hypothetical protein
LAAFLGPPILGADQERFQDRIVVTTSKPRRRGRPSSISREKISQAVMDVTRQGGDVNMQAVAAMLSVDVTTLYRHLNSQVELSRMVAELAAPSPDSLPDPAGKTAREWLRELAWFYWRLMRSHSTLIEHSQSAIDPKYEILEYVVGVLRKFGFSPRSAAFCYNQLINSLVGFIYLQIQDEEERSRGGGRFMDYQRCLATFAREEIPNIVSCDLTVEDFDPEAAFEVFLNITLDGIIAQMGK